MTITGTSLFLVCTTISSRLSWMATHQEDLLLTNNIPTLPYPGSSAILNTMVFMHRTITSLHRLLVKTGRWPGDVSPGSNSCLTATLRIPTTSNQVNPENWLRNSGSHL